MATADMENIIFDLYFNLIKHNEVIILHDVIICSERRGLAVTQFYEWFRAPLHRWIKIAKFKVMNRTKKAVELDKVAN